MADGKDSPCKSPDLDVENMKVIEIKKRLKGLGLPTTGNKSELVERLQVAMITSKEELDIDASPTGNSLTPPDTSTDSSPFKFSDHLDGSLPLSPSIEIDIAQERIDPPQSSLAPAPVPLKKRAVVHSPVENVTPKKKRIVLNRNNFPTPKLVPTVDPIKVEANVEAGDKKPDEATAEESEKAGVKKVVHLSNETKKNLSEAEKIKMRAKRFNLTTEAPTKSVNAAKGNQIEFKPSLATSSPLVVPNVELLKKRAERFGENVSSVLKKLEDQEKIIKRKSKFGDEDIKNGVSGSDEQEKKKKRAERFGN